MPKPLQYKNGSLLYCKGEEADKVFVLQSGKINLVYEDIETGENICELVQPGEFFGVKSALGRYPREENAIFLSDSVVAAFTVTEFELFAMSNTKIILSMLKTFSSQMRQIHAKVSSLLEKDEIQPDEGLFGIGEKYLKNKRFSHAKYIFKRYLECYPWGKDAANAQQNLHIVEIAITQAAQESAQNASGQKKGQKFEPEKAYYSGVNLINKGKIKEALELFTRLAYSKEKPVWAAKGVFETGRCLFFLNNFEDCINHYKNMFVQYPSHPDLKDAMFYMGQSCEKTGKKDVAAGWYKKVISMPGVDTDGTRSKTLQALEALEKSR